MHTVGDWVILIGAIAAGIVLVINAVGQWWGHVDAKNAQTDRTKLAVMATVADRKLDQIHEATNGGVQMLRDKLAEAVTEIARLQKLILDLKGNS